MTLRSVIRHTAAPATARMLTVAPASAAEINVMCMGAFKAAYLELANAFESASGHTIASSFGPSIGALAIPNRLARGQPAEVVIVLDEAMDGLVKEGAVIAGSRAELACSLIEAAVRIGQPKPDIGTVEALKRAFADASSIAYSSSASGVYISTDLYPKLGVSDAIRAKSKTIQAEPVGEAGARGEAELGFQQLSELKPIKGIDIVGPIPAEVQKVTVISVAIATIAQAAEAAPLR